MIPHKVLNIRCYICTCLALFFIFVFIRLLEYQILQFHTLFLRSGLAMKAIKLCMILYASDIVCFMDYIYKIRNPPNTHSSKNTFFYIAC